MPLSPRLDHVGPIARRVDDLARMFAVMSDREIDLSGTRSANVAQVEGFFIEQADEAVVRVTRDAIKRLEAATIVQGKLSLPNSFDKVHLMQRRMMAAEAAAVHRHSFSAHPEAFSPHITTLINEGLALSAVDYADALNHQVQFRRDWVSMIGSNSVAIMAATNTAAPASLDSTGDSQFQSPWSFAGVPTVSIPCGLATNGLPCALQLVGSPGSEIELLKAAAACQSELQFEHPIGPIPYGECR